MLKRKAPYTERLLFDVPRGSTADLDTPKPAPMMKEMISGTGRESDRASQPDVQPPTR